MKIKKRNVSKKNSVFQVEFNKELAILKIFNDKEGYFKEKEYYNIFNSTNLNTPKLLECNDVNNTIKIEYINGKTVLEHMEEYESIGDLNSAYKLLKDVFYWLQNFHSLMYIESNNLSFYDLNLRNFILYDDIVYGIDFESINRGNLLSDTGKLIGMYLNYDEKYSDFKKKTVKSFDEFLIDKKIFSRDELDNIIKFEIVEIEKRRKNKSLK